MRNASTMSNDFLSSVTRPVPDPNTTRDQREKYMPKSIRDTRFLPPAKQKTSKVRIYCRRLPRSIATVTRGECNDIHVALSC